MAELSPATTYDCCATDQQAGCVPADKDGCCTPESSSCGCAAGQTSDPDAVREMVRERYASAARAASGGTEEVCDWGVGVSGEHGNEVFGAALYRQEEDADNAPGAVAASLGCGVPTAAVSSTLTVPAPGTWRTKVIGSGERRPYRRNRERTH